jgi:hypothetical protein
VPTAIAVTTFPETVQIEVLVEVNETAPVPDPPVVESVAVDPTRREFDIETERFACVNKSTA